MDEFEFLDRLRENIKPEVEEQEESQQQLREFAQWLLIVPLIMIVLFGCGQLAIFTSSEAALDDTQSRLTAEYGQWPYVQVRGIRGEIVEEIRKDESETQDPKDTYNDPVEIVDPWVDSELPPIVIVQLPAAGTPSPTGNPSAGFPDPGQDPTSTPQGTSSLGATSTPTGTITFTPWPTATADPTSTDNPSATRTFTPTPSRTPTKTPTLPPTQPGAPTWTPSLTPTKTSTPTQTPIPSNTPTNTPVPPTSTNTPTSQPATNTPPPDYCSTFNFQGTSATDWENMGTVIKFEFFFTNSIPMNLTSYSVSFMDSGLSLHRAKTINGDPSRPKLLGSHGSSPATGCESCPVPYPASGTHEIYNMFCVSAYCSETAEDTPIAPGSYNFSASGTFLINGVSCPFSRSASVTID